MSAVAQQQATLDTLTLEPVEAALPATIPPATAPQTAQVHALRPATATPADLLRIAMDSGADLDRLERLYDMQQRWLADQARTALADAMVEFKKVAPVITKDHRVNYTKRDQSVVDYKHATLGNVVKTITAMLADFGISASWDPHFNEGRLWVTCTLTHRLGHEKSVSLPGPMDDSGGKNAIQAMGSTITYLERYTLLAVTGLATEEDDDDGNGAGGKGAGGTDADKAKVRAENEEFDRLLDAGRDKASQGTNALRAWWDKTLTEPQRDLLKPELQSLRHAAKRYDADQKGAR